MKLKHNMKLFKNKLFPYPLRSKIMSEVGFEPTPSHEDQNLSLAP
jgi:hypothetical protein